MDKSLIAIAITTMIAALGWFLAHFAKRLERCIEGLTASISSLRDEIIFSNKRHDVQDVVISSILKDSFNSAGIVKNQTGWPRTIFSEDEDHPGPSGFHGSNGKKK